MKILIADDHSIVREGLIRILKEEHPNAECFEANNSVEILNQIRENKFDIVLLDINLPDKNGLEILKEIKSINPSPPVLVFSIHPEEQYALRVLKAGAAGYLTKESPTEELLAAIKKVIEGGKYITDLTAGKLADALDNDSAKSLHELLSNREFQILTLISSGKTAGEIAAELNLNVKTISTYRSRILQKMNMRTNAELTHYAISKNITDKY